MCKEDIRIARKAYPKQVVNDVGKTAAYKVLNANPNRFAFFGAILPTALVASSEIPMFAALVGGLYLPLVVSGGVGSMDIVTLGDAGQALTYEIWFVPGGASNTYKVFAGEVELQETLEKV